MDSRRLGMALVVIGVVVFAALYLSSASEGFGVCMKATPSCPTGILFPVIIVLAGISAVVGAVILFAARRR